MSDNTGTGSGIDWGGVVQKVVIPVATNLYATSQQKKMMQGLQQGQQQSYDKYMQTINPPEEVKQARYNQLANQVQSSIPTMQRRLASSLGARGVRGRGKASPIASQNRSVRDALNQAYFDVYTQYNVPNMPPPVNYVPSTGQLFSQPIGVIARHRTGHMLETHQAILSG